MNLLKWPGGKRRMIPRLAPYIPKEFDTYFEPFLGGGSLYLHLKPKRAFIFDTNPWLQQLWTRLLPHTDLSTDEFYQNDAAWERPNRETFARVRNRLNSHDFQLSEFLWFNRACFNGVFRVNKKNEINTPFGSGGAINRDKLLEAVLDAQRTLRDSTTVFASGAEVCPANNFYFFDPPYHGTFDAYTSAGFPDETRRDLGQRCAEIVAGGGYVLLTDSPSAADFYKHEGLHLRLASEDTSVSSAGSGRGSRDTLLVVGQRNLPR